MASDARTGNASTNAVVLENITESKGTDKEKISQIDFLDNDADAGPIPGSAEPGPPPYGSTTEPQKPRWLSSLHSVIFIITCALAVFIVFRNVLTCFLFFAKDI